MSESEENYIKAIYIIKKKDGVVRSIDVANELGFSKASVSRAMAKLKKCGLIVIDYDGKIGFTADGDKEAARIYERYSVISSFLRAIADVDDDTAQKDACGIEHVISVSTFNGIKQYLRDHPELNCQ